MKNMLNLHGIYPPLTTPFENEKVSVSRLQKNLEILSSHELAGYVLLGSNGEAPLLHELEKIQVIKAARMITPDTRTLIIGTGMESINATVRMSKIAAEYGGEVLLVITPFYYKGQMDGAALKEYFLQVADKVKLPLLIYNVPKVTGVSIPPETVAELSGHDRIIGIKDSSGDMNYLLRLLAAVPEDFTVLCGNATIFTSALAAGASGGILGLANGLPEPLASIYSLVSQGDVRSAMEIQLHILPIIAATIGGHGVAGVKALMDIRGMQGGAPRTPLISVADDIMKSIREELKSLESAKVISHLSLL